MRVMHYLFGLPPVRGGGLVKYVLDLAEGQRNQGLDVCLLVPGEIRKRKETTIQKKRYSGFTCYHVINPVLVSCGKRISDMNALCERGDLETYIKFLKTAAPDVIHIHSLMGLHLAFLQAAKQLCIPMIYTTHDYYGICLKCSNFAENGVECRKDGSMCRMCMGGITSTSGLQRQHMEYYAWLKRNFIVKWLEYSKKILKLKWWLREKMKNYAKPVSDENTEFDVDSFKRLKNHYKEMFSYITFFHFNSSQTEKVYKMSLGNIEGKVIHISNHSVADNRKVRSYGKTLKLAYLSNRQAIKGYEVLMDTLEQLYNDGFQDFECHIYCNEDRFGVPYLKTHKPYTEKSMKKVFENMDVLIVPSLWKETFGMVALEAISYGVPVILSENVGAKDIFDKNKGIGIKVDMENDKNALYDAIKKVYENRQLLVQMNRNIMEAKIDFCYDRHIKEITELYESILD